MLSAVPELKKEFPGKAFSPEVAERAVASVIEDWLTAKATESQPESSQAAGVMLSALHAQLGPQLPVSPM